MYSATLKRLWLDDKIDPLKIRLDWSNDRHHDVLIEPPFTKNEVIKALDDLCYLILRDSHLK
jgi:hypothetical protein